MTERRRPEPRDAGHRTDDRPPDGYLLDITDDRDGRGVVLWIKDRRTGRVSADRRPFRPPFFVDGPRPLLRSIAQRFSERPDVASVAWVTLTPSLFDRRPRRLLAMTPGRTSDRRRLATEIDALGDFHRLTLYDVDLTGPQLYHLTHGLYPFAPVRRVGETLVATEAPELVEYTTPALSSSILTVDLLGQRRGGIVTGDPPIERIHLGGTTLEGGSERELLLALVEEVERQDPDVILTDGGDGFELPRLYRRAVTVGLSERSFYLGREPAAFRPYRKASSFETYGQVLHREASFPLPGRFHIDRENSFLYGDAAIDGLIDAARLSRLSLQTIVRQSPGTCFTAMEIAHALEDGVHIPWKKNRPEEFKSALALVEADRGGVIFVPPVGVHDGVDEFDFASLYPHIMVRNNLSTETLNCRCCPKSPRVTPVLGYRSCTKKVGLIPRTLGPLLARRLSYKAGLARPGVSASEKERLKRRAKMLKWILVTAFGYQGYRNARFGRIECHEAINAYARDLLARLLYRAEASGYRVVHGIVDSIWVKPLVGRRVDPAEFVRLVEREFDLPLGYEGRYRWIVFLPSVTGIGVPNRYYGMYENGEFKLRGIGSRRHDTPILLRRFEGEILNMLSRARDAGDVYAITPRLLARADLFAERIRSGAWPVEELLISHRLLQEARSFVTFTDTLAALRQLSDRGVERSPGEFVRYVVLDRRSRSWRQRVRVAELIEGGERYDPDAYLDLLAKSAETILGPIGITRESLGLRWNLSQPPERARYRSPEAAGQRAVPVSADR